jgi:O-acetyl-ADP-ribose deacetylase (regulator of RNase III)
VQTGFDVSNVSESNGELRAVVSNCEICVVNGRIEDQPVDADTVVALPCNEYFDDRCTDDARSALGVYVSRHFKGSASNFSSLIREHCRKKFGPGVEQQKTEDEIGESFGVGRCVLLTRPFGHPASVALVATTTQRAGHGLTGRISYLFDGMRGLFSQLADARIDKVVMPIMGAGHGGIDPPLALVGLVLALAEAARSGTNRHRRKVTIVVFKPTPAAAPEVSPGVIRRTLALVANKD